MPEYSRSTYFFRQCRLSPADLHKIESLMTLDGDDDAVNISAEISSRTHARFAAGSIEELLRHAELPDRLGSINFTSRRWRPDHRSIHVNCWKSGARVATLGQDETWVLGRHEQLKSFLKARRIPIWQIPDFLIGAPLAVLVFVIVRLLFDAIYAKIESYAIAVTFVGMIIVQQALLFALHDFINQDYIVLHESQQRIDWQKVGAIAAIIAIPVTIILAVLW